MKKIIKAIFLLNLVIICSGANVDLKPEYQMSATLYKPVYTFATLPPEQDGKVFFCVDCMNAVPCLGGGTGSLVIDANGVHGCGIPTGPPPLSLANYTGATNITDNQSNGNGTVNHVNVNRTVNPDTYGADPTHTSDSATAFNNAISFAESSTTNNAIDVHVPPGFYKILSPIVIKATNAYRTEFYGSGRQITHIDAAFNGPDIVIASRYTFSNSGITTTSSCPVGTCTALSFSDTAQAMFNLNEVLGASGNGASPLQGPFDNMSAWTIKLIIKPDAKTLSQTGCIASSTGAYNYILHPQSFNETSSDDGMYGLCIESDAKIHAFIKTGGVVHWADSPTAMTAGTVYEIELNFDGAGSHVNLFQGAVGSSIPRVTQVSASGVTNQRADEWNVIGGAVLAFPSSPLGFNNLLQGAVLQSIKISKIAIDTGTSFAADTGNQSNDANTLFLWNFSGSMFPSSNPIAQIENAVPPNGGGYSTTNNWISLLSPGIGCCGGQVFIHDFQISGGGLGIVVEEPIIFARHIETGPNNFYGGFQNAFGSSFLSTGDDIITDGNGIFGQWWGSGIVNVTNSNVGPANFAFIGQNGIYTNTFSLQNARTQCGGLFVTATTQKLNITTWEDDSENGGNFASMCFQNATSATISHSVIQGQGSTAGAIQLIDKTSHLNFIKDDFQAGGPVYVDATYATPTTDSVLDFDRTTFNTSELPAQPYTNNGMTYQIRNQDTIPINGLSPIFPKTASGFAAGSGNATTINVTYNGGTQINNVRPGQILVALVRIGGGGALPTVTPPVAVGTDTSWSGPVCTANNGGNPAVEVFTKIATGTDQLLANGNPGYAFTTSSASFSYNIWVIPVSGANQGAVTDHCFTNTASGVTSFGLTGGTDTDQNSIVIPFIGTANDFQGTNLIATSSPPTGTYIIYPFIPSTFSVNVPGPVGYSYHPNSLTVPTFTVTAPSTSWAGLQLSILPGIAQTPLMTADVGSPFLYANQSGARLNDLLLNAFNKFNETTAPTGLAGFDFLYGDSATHRLKVNPNNTGPFPLGEIIATGTSALGTGAITNATCASTITTTATGVLTTDTIIWSHNASVTGGTNGSLIIHSFPTANNVNFQECNPTAAGITPPADTLNWMVIR